MNLFREIELVYLLSFSLVNLYYKFIFCFFIRTTSCFWPNFLLIEFIELFYLAIVIHVKNYPEISVVKSSCIVIICRISANYKYDPDGTRKPSTSFTRLTKMDDVCAGCRRIRRNCTAWQILGYTGCARSLAFSEPVDDSQMNFTLTDSTSQTVNVDSML